MQSVYLRTVLYEVIDLLALATIVQVLDRFGAHLQMLVVIIDQ